MGKDSLAVEATDVVNKLVTAWKQTGNQGFKTEEEARQYYTSALGARKSSGADKQDKRLSKFMISEPKSFQHLSHIGWTENGFDMRNVPKDWLKFFEQAGLTEDQLKDKETAEFIVDFVKQNGGLPTSSSIQELQQEEEENPISPSVPVDPLRNQLQQDAKTARETKPRTASFLFRSKEKKYVPKTDPTYIDPVIVALQSEIERKGFLWDESKKRVEELVKERDTLIGQRDHESLRARNAEAQVALLMTKISGMDSKELTAALQNERELMVASLNKQLADSKAAMEQLRRDMEEERERALVKQRLDFESMMGSASAGQIKNQSWFRSGKVDDTPTTDGAQSSGVPAPPPPPPVPVPPPPPAAAAAATSSGPLTAHDLLAGLQAKQLRKVEPPAERRMEDLAMELAKALHKRLKAQKIEDAEEKEEESQW